MSRSFTTWNELNQEVCADLRANTWAGKSYETPTGTVTLSGVGQRTFWEFAVWVLDMADGEVVAAARVRAADPRQWTFQAAPARPFRQPALPGDEGRGPGIDVNVALKERPREVLRALKEKRRWTFAGISRAVGCDIATLFLWANCLAGC